MRLKIGEDDRLHHVSLHHRPRAPQPCSPSSAMISSKLISNLNICVSPALPPPTLLPPSAVMTSPHSTSFSHASLATSRPQTRPAVAVAPYADADAFALVKRRTYSGYTVEKDRVNEFALVAGLPLMPGSCVADSFVAVSSRDKGSDVVLVEFEVGGSGSAGGSGCDRRVEMKDCGVGRSI